jgi:lysylphosphatidylglycerol synthetase-like protein (DUF2156 family)
MVITTFAIQIGLFCAAVLFVAVGLLKHVTDLWMAGTIVGIGSLLFSRCTCTGLVCHLFDPELPIVMELDHPVVVPPEIEDPADAV